jgi:rod shape-determining protein MreC
VRRLSQRQRVAAILLIVAALGFVTLDVAGSSLSVAHGGVRGTLGALYRGTDSVLGPVRRFLQGIPGASSNTDRIHRLEQQDAELRARLRDAAANRRTAARLATLQLAADAAGKRVVPARVIALSPDAGFDWTVTIDVGTASRVRVGQTVTDGNGLVGRVVHADPATSVVLLAVDPHSGVGVRDTRTGQLAVATGSGAAGFTAVPLNPQARLAVGDVLVTGPAGRSSFAPGIAVGVVRAVRTAGGGRTRAEVSATTSPTSLDLVGVILTGGHTAPRSALRPQSSELAGGR